MGLITSGTKGLGAVAEHIDFTELMKAVARSGVGSAIDETPAKQPVGWAAKPVAAVAGGVAGVVAASAAVSAIRRKQEGDEDGSDG